MRLLQAVISNFRSIKDATIRFEPRCLALVGINECGKSNLLKALALLDPKREFLNDDIRDFSPDEPANQNAFVRFDFELDDSDRDACLQSISDEIHRPTERTPLMERAGETFTLSQFIATHRHAFYFANIKLKKKSPVCARLDDDWLVLDGWYQPAKGTSDQTPITFADGETRPAKDVRAVHRSLLPDNEMSKFTDCTVVTIEGMICEAIKLRVLERMPECLYWSYSETQLLPAQILLDAFAANPASCEPLREMFALADHEDVGKAINEAKTRPNGIRNLLNRVAERTTTHMRSVWKDIRGIKIELSPNGPHIEASVKYKFNLYNFARRSDGFKRFITFLLLVSAKVKNQELENTLYLHDEPDNGLHPSGARYLLKELIGISKNNYVVYSTHSIFMIDREEIGRHLIVTKEHEVTTAATANESNISDEEVIYNALGYSLFESLRPRNIIFEGWRDKRLFQVALRASSARARALNKAFKEVGVCHARGVRDVGRVTPLLELAQRKWIVISDADKPAREQQDRYDGEGPWFRYDELLGDGAVVTTSEDFIRVEAFKPILGELQKRHPSLPHSDLTTLGGSQNRLHAVRQWLASNGVNDADTRAGLEYLKKTLFDNLKPAAIEDRFFDVCDAILEKLQSL
jgi:energy-coupling factor transporter ATP-binding protein EcfA2